MIKKKRLLMTMLLVTIMASAALFAASALSSNAVNQEFPNTLSSSTSSSPSPTCEIVLTAMNYNTRQLPRFLGFNDWDQAARLRRLTETLRLPIYQADVLILNELVTEWALLKVKGLTDVYPYMTSVVGRNCSGVGLDSLSGRCHPLLPRSGVMALSKFPILESHGLIFANAAAGTWDARCNKGALYIKVNVNGTFVHVVGTHLQADEGGVDATGTRVAQVAEMRRWMERFEIPKAEPILLVGDINVQFGSREFHQMFDGRFALSFRPGPISSYSPSTNWLARADRYFAGRSLYDDNHLDYVAVWADHAQPVRNADMRVIKLKAKVPWHWSYLQGWWRLRQGLFRHDGFYSDVSDHYPVAATFHFPTAGGCRRHPTRGWLRKWFF